MANDLTNINFYSLLVLVIVCADLVLERYDVSPKTVQELHCLMFNVRRYSDKPQNNNTKTDNCKVYQLFVVVLVVAGSPSPLQKTNKPLLFGFGLVLVVAESSRALQTV